MPIDRNRYPEDKILSGQDKPQDTLYDPYEFSEAELERDFCICANMLLGQNYEEAQRSAKEWMKDARD